MSIQQSAIQPYLFFGGRCQEAIDYYKAAVGAEVDMLMRFSDSPEPMPEGMLAPGFENKVMHSAFRVGGSTILASDGCTPEDGAKKGFSLALMVPTEADADRAFDALADGGEVGMPLSKTFWSPRYGMVKDRFGVNWMVMVPGAAAMSAIRKQKITPCLWCNLNAEEMVAHYTSIFKDSKVTKTLRYGPENPALQGKVLLMEFELAGQQFQALNVGPQFPFTNAISLSVDCKDQAEVDELWTRLCEGGSEGNCSWLTDKFGLSWQIVPHRLPELLSDPDPARAQRAMQAMMTMNKIDIAAIERAAAG